MRHQGADIAPKDSMQQISRSVPLVLFFFDEREEHKRAAIDLMIDRAFVFESPQKSLHSAVRDRFGRTQGVGDLPRSRTAPTPKHLHDPKLHASESNGVHGEPFL